MKRIAIFADGTWNSPRQGRATNVLRMARAVRPEAGGTQQVVFYDWGVGTDRKKSSGGFTGACIDKNIMDCYRFLVHNYDDDDQLFFFGFSRGAYTARSLAGFIRNCGILKREHANRISDAFRLYRKRTRASRPDEAIPVRFRRDFAVANITPIEFVGAWDTGERSASRCRSGAHSTNRSFYSMIPSRAKSFSTRVTPCRSTRIVRTSHPCSGATSPMLTSSKYGLPACTAMSAAATASGD